MKDVKCENLKNQTVYRISWMEDDLREMVEKFIKRIDKIETDHIKCAAGIIIDCDADIKAIKKQYDSIMEQYFLLKRLNWILEDD